MSPCTHRSSALLATTLTRASGETPGRVPGEITDVRARELRTLGERHAEHYAGTRAGGRADVVVVRGERREGLTEDYLSVPIEGSVPARGERIAMRLEWRDSRLRALPLT